MKDRIVRFLDDLDRSLIPLAGQEQMDLLHIGRSALVWKYGFLSATVDVDFIQPKGPENLFEEARRLFGKGTTKAKEHELYLEYVPEGTPPLPIGSQSRATQATGPWKVIRLFHLEDHDFIVTKLKRFAAKDREDIRQLCDMRQIDPEILQERVALAYYWVLPKDDDKDRDKSERSLRLVQAYLRGESEDL